VEQRSSREEQEACCLLVSFGKLHPTPKESFSGLYLLKTKSRVQLTTVLKRMFPAPTYTINDDFDYFGTLCKVCSPRQASIDRALALPPGYTPESAENTDMDHLLNQHDNFLLLPMVNEKDRAFVDSLLNMYGNNDDNEAEERRYTPESENTIEEIIEERPELSLALTLKRFMYQIGYTVVNNHKRRRICDGMDLYPAKNIYYTTCTNVSGTQCLNAIKLLRDDFSHGAVVYRGD
jgi:hypothetical protein